MALYKCIYLLAFISARQTQAS